MSDEAAMDEGRRALDIPELCPLLAENDRG
jgi:hypothetical protein